MSGDRPRVVLASHNPHKLEEIRRILSDTLAAHDGTLPFDLVSYDGPEPRETGVSFEENALIKARAAVAHTGLPAIADDSGIAVDVLGGAPGIFSARWSGPAKDARDNVNLLLWQLSDVAPEHRAAKFVATAALVWPDGREVVERGEWQGWILSNIRGDQGFGYDPIFAPRELPDGFAQRSGDPSTRSAAELSPADKDALSHRRRAFDALAPHLRF